MATVEKPRTVDVSARATSPEPKGRSRTRTRGAWRWRWTAEQYHQLIDLGLWHDRRVQLLNGEIYEMAPQKAAHANAVEKLDDELRAAFGPDFRIRIQLPLDLGARSEPEPDGAVVPRGTGVPSQHPRDPVLIVEVSETTLREDRKLKAPIYAQAGIPEYWIVNLVDRLLEVYRNPGPDPDRPGRYTYHDVTILPAEGLVSPLAKPDARLNVADLLP